MYSHVVFTGGGLAGLSYLGIIRYFQEYGLHKNVHEVAGTSIGSLFACLFAMNVPAGDVETYTKYFFKQEENITYPLIEPAISLLDTYGLDDGERMVKPLRHFIKELYGWADDIVTIRDFVKKTGINIVICATNLETRRATYFNIDNTPDVNIYDAVKASMAVPLLVRPIEINGTMYVDGGITDNMPIKGCKINKPNTAFILSAACMIDKDIMPDNIVNYIGVLLQTVMNNTCDTNQLANICTDYDILELDKPPIPFLKVKTYDDATVRIDITDEHIDMAVVHGYMNVYEFMKNKEKRKQLAGSN